MLKFQRAILNQNLNLMLRVKIFNKIFFKLIDNYQFGLRFVIKKIY